jgi:hypothetical protein
MSKSRVGDWPVMYSVGGRLYRLADCNPTCVRLEDLLDGQCLSFTQAEALQMFVQQDLIILRRTAMNPRGQTDPRDRPYRPDGAQGDDPECLAEATVPLKQTARRPAVSLPDVPADAKQRRRGAVERPCRCIRRQQWVLERLASLGYRPTGHVRSIILDEVSRYLSTDAVTRAQTLALINIYVQALKLCPDLGGIARCQQREERWLSERHPTIAPTALDGHRLKSPALTVLTPLAVAPRSRLVGRAQWFQPDQSMLGLARHPRGGALERAEWRRATAERGLNAALDAEVGDVE